MMADHKSSEASRDGRDRPGEASRIVSDNPWIDAARARAVLEAVDRVRTAATPADVDRILRTTLSNVYGHPVSINLRGRDFGRSLASVQDIAAGLLAAAARDPTRKLRAVITDNLADGPDTYAVTRFDEAGVGRVVFNSHWLSERLRDDYLAALDADGRRNLPGNPEELAQHHILSADPDRGEYRATRQADNRGAYGRAAVLDRSVAQETAPPETLSQRRANVDAATTVEAVEAELRKGLRDALGRDVEVDLQGDGTSVTDLDSAKEITSGLLVAVERLPAATTLRSVTIADMATSNESFSYATTFHYPSERKSDIVFNTWWHQEENRGGYIPSLDEDYEERFLAGRTPADLAIHEYAHVLSRGASGWTLAGTIPGYDTSLPEQLRKFRSDAAPSRYALENIEELTAESVVDVLRNGDKAAPMSRLVFDRLEAAYATGLHLGPNRGQAATPDLRTTPEIVARTGMPDARSVHRRSGPTSEPGGTSEPVSNNPQAPHLKVFPLSPERWSQ